MPADPARRYETIQWVFFQMAAVGPMFGQLGYFHKFAGREIEDKRPLERYAPSPSACSACWKRGSTAGSGSWARSTPSPTSRMLGWVRNLIGFYGAGELVEYDSPEARPRLAGARPRPSGRAARLEHSEAAVGYQARWLAFG